jgi:hypothetical protein
MLDHSHDWRGFRLLANDRPNGLEMMPGWGIARTNVPPD